MEVIAAEHRQPAHRAPTPRPPRRPIRAGGLQGDDTAVPDLIVRQRSRTAFSRRSRLQSCSIPQRSTFRVRDVRQTISTTRCRLILSAKASVPEGWKRSLVSGRPRCSRSSPCLSYLRYPVGHVMREFGTTVLPKLGRLVHINRCRNQCRTRTVQATAGRLRIHGCVRFRRA